MDELMLSIVGQGNPLGKDSKTKIITPRELQRGTTNNQNLDLEVIEEELSEDADINRDYKNKPNLTKYDLKGTLDALLEEQKKIVAFKPPKSDRSRSNL